MERVSHPIAGPARLVRLLPTEVDLVPVEPCATERTITEWSERIGAERVDATTSALSEIGQSIA